MTEPPPPGTLDDPFARLEGPLAAAIRLRLTVTGVRDLTPGMREVTFTAPELTGFSYRPGQDVMLLVAVDGNRPVRRRYTIRALDAATGQLTLGVVRHGEGPGERWLDAATPGDQVEGIAPRGKIFPAEGVDWHLFAGDFSALPAFFRMTESLPAGTPATLIIEVPGPRDEQPLAAVAAARVRWVHRGGAPAGDDAGLLAALKETQLPPGQGHAYLAGEAKVVLALREALEERGMADHLNAKAYWGRGKANASHGEPPKDT